MSSRRRTELLESGGDLRVRVELGKGLELFEAQRDAEPVPTSARIHQRGARATHSFRVQTRQMLRAKAMPAISTPRMTFGVLFASQASASGGAYDARERAESVSGFLGRIEEDLGELFVAELAVRAAPEAAMLVTGNARAVGRDADLLAGGAEDTGKVLCA
jgi:hypothetical protein